MQRVLVVDNGGYALRAGWAGEAAPRVTIPNAAGRAKRSAALLIADEAESSVRDPSQLSWLRPTERGAVVDPLLQALIWERALGPAHLNVDGDRSAAAGSAPDLSSTGLVLTAPAFAPSALEALPDELAFERFGFGALHRAPASQMALWSVRGGAALALPTAAARAASGGSLPPAAAPHPAWHFASTGTGVVIDAGYSGTTVTPYAGWRPVPGASTRLDVGGKHLTNALKEAVSYRQYNMMDDTWLVNKVKERLCFVSQAFDVEMEITRRLGAPGAVNRLARAQAAGGGVPPPPYAAAAATAAAPVPASGAGTAAAVPTTYARRRPLPSRPAAAAPAAAAAGSGASSSSSSAAEPPAVVGDGGGVGIRREYVLPDYLAIGRGYVKGEPSEDVYMQARAALEAAHAAAAERDAAEAAAGTGAGAGAAQQAPAPAPATAAAGATSASAASQPSKQPAPSASAAAAAASRKRPRPTDADAPSAAPAPAAATQQPKAGGKKGKESAPTAAAAAGSKGGPAAKKKGDAAAAAADGDDAEGGGSGGEDDDSSISETDSDEEDDDDDEGSDDGTGDYKGKAASSSAGAPAPARTASRRAASSGVRALTSSLKREGIVAEGEDDEEMAAAGGSSSSAAVAAYSSASSSAADAGYRPSRAPAAYGSAALGAGVSGSGLTTPDGRILPQEGDLQTLVMGCERIAVPEALFQPSLAGLAGQGGLHEAVAASIDRCPPALRPLLWPSLLLVGGSAQLPGLEHRLTSELARLAPSGCSVHAFTPADPVVAAWSGGSWLGSQLLQQPQPQLLARGAPAAFGRAPSYGGAGAPAPAYSLRLPTVATSAAAGAGTATATVPVPVVTKAQWAEEGPRACRRAFRLSAARYDDSDDEGDLSAFVGGSGSGSAGPLSLGAPFTGGAGGGTTAAPTGGAAAASSSASSALSASSLSAAALGNLAPLPSSMQGTTGSGRAAAKAAAAAITATLTLPPQLSVTVAADSDGDESGRGGGGGRGRGRGGGARGRGRGRGGSSAGAAATAAAAPRPPGPQIAALLAAQLAHAQQQHQQQLQHLQHPLPPPAALQRPPGH